MFESLASNVKKSKSTSQRRVEIPRTVGFVTALRDNGLRLTYAALARAAQQLGEHTPTAMSEGQRGAALLSGLPAGLQPFVCNSSGGYKKGQEWPEAEDAPSVDALRQRGFVKPDVVSQFVQAYIRSTEEPEPSDEELDTIEEEDEEPPFDVE